MANTYLYRTPSSAGNRKTWTWSAWIKLSDVGVETPFFATPVSTNDTGWFSIRLNGNSVVIVGLYNTNFIVTNRRLRDTNGWYNICVSFDSTNSTASDRCKLFINGVRETSFANSSNPTLNQDYNMNNNVFHSIGEEGNTFFNGSMSHVHFIDGTAYDASAFGSFDNDTGEWSINTSPSVTYGTNGFFILKDGNSVTDQSGNSNNFTVSGNLTKTEDNPSNVFATLNPLFPSGNATPFTYSFGNTKISETVGVWQTTTSTLGASSGKYYAEFKCFGNVMFAGVVDLSSTTRGVSGYNAFSSTQVTSYGYGYYNGDGTIRYGGAELNPYGDSYTTNDIIGVALDCDNNKLYFSKNGVWQNSGVPTSGSTGTGAMSLNTDDGRVWGFALSTEYQVAESNFGNGYFGTTAVSSAGTNASGNGIFEYDVPTGYTALSTKGLNL